MQLPNRSRRHLDRKAGGSIPDPPDSDQSGTTGGTVEPPASFDEWLDARLRTLYEAVVNEPLPPEILELLNRSDEGK